MREALAQARTELGSGALVLSTRLVAAPGWRGVMGARQVEVTAAVDREVSEVRPPPQEDRHPQPAAEADSGIVALLTAAGLDAAFAAEVAASIPGSRRRSPSAATLAKALGAHLEALVGADAAYAPVEAFVGPPGAGKTTTIAKIASQERARRGKRLKLVAAEGFRVGAVEQLRLYADIIGSPCLLGEGAAALGRSA